MGHSSKLQNSKIPHIHIPTMQDGGCSESLKNGLCDAQNRVKNQSSRLAASEADTRCILIEPVLKALDWDTMDTRQVRREYNPYRKGDRRSRLKVDYVLFIDDAPCVLVEAKKLNLNSPSNSIDRAKYEIEHTYCKDTKYTGIATDGHTWSVWQNKRWNDIQIGSDNACEQMLAQISKDSINNQTMEQISVIIKKFDPKELVYSKGVESRTDTNEAIQIFSRFVIKNKDKFQHEKDFYQLLRAYLNILLWAEKKTEVKNILDSFDGLRHKIKNTIIEKSKMGKFVGFARTLRWKNTKYRKEFLDLIETFTSTNQYDELLEKLKMFVTKTRSGNTATLTGIISALQPDHFMVYNQRSSLPLRDTIYKDFTDVKMSRYWDFNTIYRRISQNTGRSLVELDTIANDRHWDNRDSNQN